MPASTRRSVAPAGQEALARLRDAWRTHLPRGIALLADGGATAVKPYGLAALAATCTAAAAAAASDDSAGGSGSGCSRRRSIVDLFAGVDAGGESKGTAAEAGATAAAAPAGAELTVERALEVFAVVETAHMPSAAVSYSTAA